jgi:hypothetical protein
MKSKWIIALGCVLVIQPALKAEAMECPQHIEGAEAAIKTANETMKAKGSRMTSLMDEKEMGLVHTLLANAKIMLITARRHHEHPQGPYDHARAIAKADAARGYAMSVDILHRRYSAK